MRLIGRFVKYLLLKQFSELFVSVIACEDSVHCNRYLSRFLGDNDNHRVGVFAHADSGSVTRTEFLVYESVLCGLWQKAGSREYLSVTHDDRSVMQGSFRVENIAENLLARVCVENSSRFDLLTEANLPLNDNECACAGSRKFYA